MIDDKIKSIETLIFFKILFLSFNIEIKIIQKLLHLFDRYFTFLILLKHFIELNLYHNTLKRYDYYVSS